MSTTFNYTEPQIITSDDINKRSYIEFYLNYKRVRVANGDTLNQRISPNRAKTIRERSKLLLQLQYELKKALESGNYPVRAQNTSNSLSPTVITSLDTQPAISLLFKAVRSKLRSSLSKKYKRNLKAVYRQFKAFLTAVEQNAPLNAIPLIRIETFLQQYVSTNTYYMNKRRDLGVLFSAAGRHLSQPTEIVKETERKRPKAKLHVAYDKDQLKPILSFIKQHHYNLYVCCLLTYSSWLRPHEEIRLLTVGDFKKNFTEVHLTGSGNKGGRVRVVYIPEYVRVELLPILSKLDREYNIFSKDKISFDESYFNTAWQRVSKKMIALGLIYQNQTIYSFRHAAAVDTYRRTKDVYLLQKLLGHSSILVTLKYLRSLGEFNSDELRDAAPQL